MGYWPYAATLSWRSAIYHELLGSSDFLRCHTVRVAWFDEVSFFSPVAEDLTARSPVSHTEKNQWVEGGHFVIANLQFTLHREPLQDGIESVHINRSADARPSR